jgi:hypothetical protein
MVHAQSMHFQFPCAMNGSHGSPRHGLSRTGLPALCTCFVALYPVCCWVFFLMCCVVLGVTDLDAVGVDQGGRPPRHGAPQQTPRTPRKQDTQQHTKGHLHSCTDLHTETLLSSCSIADTHTTGRNGCQGVEHWEAYGCSVTPSLPCGLTPACMSACVSVLVSNR